MHVRLSRGKFEVIQRRKKVWTGKIESSTFCIQIIIAKLSRLLHICTVDPACSMSPQGIQYQ